MTIELDHLIIPVNDLDTSVRFYADVLGFGHEGQDGPFAVLRVSPSLTLQLAPWGTQGGEHLAFALASDEFDTMFTRLRDTGIAYGDSYHDVGNMRGPGTESGARGAGATVYFNDPDGHLLEIRCYALR